MEAKMGSGKPTSAISYLWQVPVFLVSLVLFLYANYRFISPHFLTAKEKLDIASALLAADRPEAAMDQVNALLTAGKLHGELEGEGHLIIAKALDQAQAEHHYTQVLNDANIVEESKQALALGVKPTGDIYRRIAQSYESLHRPADALANYRLAIKVDPKLELNYGKKLIELQIASKDPAAEQSLDAYLNQAELSPSEKAWAVDQKVQLLMAAGKLDAAVKVIQSGLTLNVPPSLLGPLNYRMGVIQWRQKQSQAAERSLRLARDQLGVEQPLDANAACLLGQILHERKDDLHAIAFFQAVITSHPESDVAALALLGRGNCRIGMAQDEPGLSDLHDVTQQILAKNPAPQDIAEIIGGLKEAQNSLSNRSNFAGALEAIGYEQQLTPKPAAEFFARLGHLYEQRADQLNQALADASDSDRAAGLVQIGDLRAKAGDAYVAYSRALTLGDDGGYGDAMWKGIDLYDQAGDIQRTISALETFVNERPDDALTPDALLRLGRAYQAGGQFDKAIAIFTRNQFRYPNTLAASKSAVPLAQSYIAKGPDFFVRAESVLRSVLENNPLLTPKAEEFKQALFELGQLYYRTGRFEEAVGRLQEWTERYPTNPQMGRVLFLMGDSYRKSAMLLDAQIVSAPAATTQPAPDLAEETTAHRARLTHARQFYDRLIDWHKDKLPETDVDKLQLKLAHFYRADCVYDLGNYADAVKLYDEAAFRYQDDPSALAAYVQIVNAYCAMGKIDEAKAANERAKWLLRRMPPDAFSDNGLGMPRKYWDQWLAWTSNSGMWK
jgi:tetratricopeptide (TPR) repeat protein